MEQIILKNNNMAVELDQSMVMRNISIAGNIGEFPAYNSCCHQVGIWNNKHKFSWINDMHWRKNIMFEQDKKVAYAQFDSEKYEITLDIEDFIHSDEKLYLRKLTLNNESKYNQDLRLFFQQDFLEKNETVVYSLGEKSLYHQVQGRYILFNGSVDQQGIVQCSTSLNNEKILFDLDKGKLAFNPISSGQTKSIFSLETSLLPYEIKNIYYWMAIGNSFDEVNFINNSVKKNPEWLIQEYIGQKNTNFERCYIGK